MVRRKSQSKTMTIMFIDIVGYTNMSSRISRQKFDEMDDKFEEIALPMFERWNGWVVKKIGDCFMVAFESATDSLHCASELQNKFFEYNQSHPEIPIRIKAAINTGEVLIKKDDVYGETVNAVARLEKEAKPGQIVFSHSTFLSMNKGEIPYVHLGKKRMKGLKFPMDIFRVKAAYEDELKRRKKKKESFFGFIWWIVALLIGGTVGYFGYLYLKSVGLF